VTIVRQQDDRLTKAVNYRRIIATKAENLLEKLLSEPLQQFQDVTGLDILVIGAGSFPSYIPFLNVLSRLVPHLQVVNFTLIEPVKAETDFFEEQFANYSGDKRINFMTYNVGIEDFLKNSDGAVFDLVYFEHPETMTLPILLAKLGMASFAKIISLRKSIPYLQNIVKPHTVIMTSSMSVHELKQMKWLLQFSLRVNPSLIFSFNPINYLYGGPYTAGLCSNTLKSHSLIQSTCVMERSNAILKSDNYFCIVLVVSLIIYCIKCAGSYSVVEQMAAIMLMYAQLLFHRPGYSGVLIKLLLLVMQFIL